VVEQVQRIGAARAGRFVLAPGRTHSVVARSGEKRASPAGWTRDGRGIEPRNEEQASAKIGSDLLVYWLRGGDSNSRPSA
jgi:hypothetical protein